MSVRNSPKSTGWVRSRFRHVGKAVLVGLVAGVTAFAGAAHADSTTGTINRLVEMSPGMTATEVRESIATIAEADGVSLDEAARTVLAEVEAAVYEVDGAACDGAVCPDSSGGGGTVQLPLAHAGAIFVSYASFLGVNHGHTGIYSESNRIVHHPGDGDVSRYKWIVTEKPKVTKPAGLYRVDTSVTIRQKAGKHALDSLRNKPYDNDFYNNKDNGSAKLNCSELVWRAYQFGGVNVDGNGGKGVYPYDIRDSSKTTKYKTL